MDVSLVIKQRLNELGLDQSDLAAATQVTQSYVSQLLTRKKAPPAPNRTEIYGRMGEFLRLPAGELSRLAEIQRLEEIKKRVIESPAPLFEECRSVVLRKCKAEGRMEVRRIFEKEPFGELERLVTQNLLYAAQTIATEQLRNETWLRAVAEASGRSHKQLRAAVLEFIDADVFSGSIEHCASFINSMIAFWAIELKTFAMEVGFNRRLSRAKLRRFEYVERQLPAAPEPGFDQFLADKSLSGDATAEEIEFLRSLRFQTRRPAALYYYREMQNLRDPLHFPPEVPSSRTASGQQPNPAA